MITTRMAVFMLAAGIAVVIGYVIVLLLAPRWSA